VKIAFLGTRGVPARYSGFETAAEEIGKRLVAAGHDVLVYCRYPGQTQRHHLGMRLVNLPAVRSKALETLSHTGMSTVHMLARDRVEAAVVFNAANAPFLPLLRAAGIPAAVNIDGLEWKRAKWAGAGQSYFKWAEGYSVRHADRVIADAEGIADYVRGQYGRDSVYIPYGAPLVEPGDDRLAELGLSPREYHLVVARFEPENHVDVIVAGYVASPARHPLVVVGSAPYSHEYVRRVHAAAGPEGAADPRVRFLGGVWDQTKLDQLYANALSYLHGHSVGGTNPSLLRAMGAGAPVTAWDVTFNREVTGGHARYFSDAASVAQCVLADEADTAVAESRGKQGRERAAADYTWDMVAERYERLCADMAGERARRPRGGAVAGALAGAVRRVRGGTA